MVTPCRERSARTPVTPRCVPARSTTSPHLASIFTHEAATLTPALSRRRRNPFRTFIMTAAVEGARTREDQQRRNPWALSGCRLSAFWVAACCGRKTVRPNPWLHLDVLQPILHRWDPAEVILTCALRPPCAQAPASRRCWRLSLRILPRTGKCLRCDGGVPDDGGRRVQAQMSSSRLRNLSTRSVASLFG